MQFTADKETLFSQWVHDHADALYNYAFRRVADEPLSKDLVQESFLSAWRNMESYRGETAVKNWLFVILKSRIIDHYRSVARKEVLHGTDVFFDQDDHWQKGHYPQEWISDPSDALVAKDFNKVFRSCNKKLKQVQQSVFSLKYVDGLESEEICKVLSISPSNFWVLMHRAKIQLRACMEKNWINK